MTLLNATYESYRTEFRELLDARFATFEARVDTRLETLKAELIRWMFIFWVGTMGTVVALLKL